MIFILKHIYSLLWIHLLCFCKAQLFVFYSRNTIKLKCSFFRNCDELLDSEKTELFYYTWNKTHHVLWLYLCIMHRFFFPSHVEDATHQESCLALIYMQPRSHTACYKYLGAVWLVNILCITLKIIASSQEIISLSCFYNKMNDVLAMTLRNSSKENDFKPDKFKSLREKMEKRTLLW